MSRYVLAPGSFAESLTPVEAAGAMAAGVHDADPGAETTCCPVGDDGAGLAQTLASALGAEPVAVPVHDAVGKPVTGVIHHAGGTVVLDAASACGLELVEPARRDVLGSDSYGAGELISAALDAGARRLVIGLGETATNDGGAGMLAALGVRFLDAREEPVATTPAGLARLASVDVSGLDPRLADLEVEAVCDVDAPLLGAHGTSATTGPRKGATPQHVTLLDTLLTRLAALCGTRGVSISAAPGAGAAGGLGWAILTFLNGRMRSGVDLVIEASGLHAALPGATAVLTGGDVIGVHGPAGSTASGVAAAAGEPGVPVVVFTGPVPADAGALLDHGVAELVAVAPPEDATPGGDEDTGRQLRAAVADWVRARR